MSYDPTKRHCLVGNWLWEYDGDDPYPARMYYVFNEDLPVEHGPTKPRWCRMPGCNDDTFGEFCERHAVGVVSV